jgi:hypothetical protein
LLWEQHDVSRAAALAAKVSCLLAKRLHWATREEALMSSMCTPSSHLGSAHKKKVAEKEKTHEQFGFQEARNAEEKKINEHSQAGLRPTRQSRSRKLFHKQGISLAGAHGCVAKKTWHVESSDCDMPLC